MTGKEPAVRFILRATAAIFGFVFITGASYSIRNFRRFPSTTPQPFEWANRLAAEGKTEEAKAIYLRAAPMAWSPGAFQNLYALAEATRDLAAQRESLRFIVEHKPTAENYTRLAQLSIQMGKTDDALRYMKESVALAPNVWQTRNNYAAFLSEAGRHADAAEQLRHAIRLAPNEPRLHRNLAKTLERLGQNDEAAERLRLAAELEPPAIPFRPAENP